jgi:transcriptional regulator with XRE-family HTH domain
MSFQSGGADHGKKTPVPLARNLRNFREDKGSLLKEVARKADISKAYLWELERDSDGS